MVSFVNIFRLLGMLFLVLIPLVLIMRRRGVPGQRWGRTDGSQV